MHHCEISHARRNLQFLQPGRRVYACLRPRMMGSGFFATLARYALPILREIGGRVLRVAGRTARDILSGQHQSLGDMLLQHTRREVSDALQPPDSSINKQEGTSLPVRKRPSPADNFTTLRQRRRRRK